jgi:bZIP transcription factor
MDILDEILLLQARQSACQPPLTSTGNTHACTYIGSEPCPAPKAVVPSPRGIQDAYFDFMGDDEQTASSAAPQQQPCVASPEQHPVRFNGKLHHPTDFQTTSSQLHGTGTTAAATVEPLTFTPSALTICPPQFAAESITPWIEDASSSPLCHDESASASTQYYDDDDDQDCSGSTLQADIKKNKVATSRVMPPTAKSILERRERALREGRRNEARLNDEERRILRRLRNRESAERCARRKNEQAQLMSMKIEHLESENIQLRSLAQEYEAEISKLEKVLWQRKASHSSA